MQIAIIDYGSGNIHSVHKALEHVAPNDTIVHTSDAQIINNADKIIFPGQGAIGNCMYKLKASNLIPTIKRNVAEKPFLGICLGLQMLFDNSEEDNCDGLSVVAGKVERFCGEMKIPHMGWNNVKQVDNPLWHNIADNSYFYSVHSYFVIPKNKEIVIGTTNYGREFTSSIVQNKLFAVQFHPEKSGDNGLQLLRNFIQLA